MTVSTLQMFSLFVLHIVLKCKFAVAILPIDDSAQILFKQFQINFGKQYSSIEEEALRFIEFNKTLYRISEFNSDISDGAQYDINKFADATDVERRMRRGRSHIIEHTGHWDGKCRSCARFPELSGNYLPDSINWETKGAVTPIKDQGNCGNCWAFGAVGDVEGVWFLAGNSLTSLSEQQLTSCDEQGGDEGCQGGDTDMDTFKYIMKNKGITTEKIYPYCSGTYSCGGIKRSGTCDKKLEKQIVANIDGSYQISGGVLRYHKPINETQVMYELSKAGPITIAINSKHFDDYNSGIMSPSICASGLNNLDHQVLIVGYGEGIKPYWIIKNSWGKSWGEKGYCRMLRGGPKNPTLNTCGVVSDASHSFINGTF